MLRRLLAVLGLALAFVATNASAQSLTTYTFATLPGSPTPGQLAWITDNSGTPTVGSPAAGGAAAGNRDLVSWDATQSRWEFVARQPTAGPAVPISTLMDAVRIAYANGTSGLGAADVQSAIDELVSSKTAVQENPSVFSMSKATQAKTTAPSVTSFGFGTQFASQSGGDSFVAETYPGSGVLLREPDNQAGFYYNKTGLDGSVIDPFEHAFDDSWELAYRSTSGTSGNTWVERNWDFTPPDQRSTVTGGAGFNPAVGSYITTPTGAGVVLAWNSGTGVLDWRQHSGTMAAGQTVTGTGGSKTLGAITQIGYLSAFRPFLYTWDSATNRATWEFRTRIPTLPDATTLKLQNGKVGVNTDQQVSAYFEAHGANSGNGFAAAWIEFLGSLHSTTIAGTGSAPGQALRLDMNYAGLHNHFATVDYGKTLIFNTPSTPPATNVVYEHVATEYADQRGIGSNNSGVLRINSQTCGGSACSDGKTGNIEILGGDFGTGHFVFGGVGAAGDHLYRRQSTNRWMTTTDANPTAAAPGRALTELVASGTRAMATAAISSGACSTADASITATGVVSTDVVKFSPNADPGLNSGLLVYSAWAGTDVISFRVCNPSAGSITPAAVTLNWRVDR